MGKLILFQGDSVTDVRRDREQAEIPNDNWGLGNGYAMLAAARLLADYPEKDYQFLNRGVSGNRVVDLYARWKIDMINLKPDVLSILIGVNDTWHEKERQNGVEVPRFEKIYRELIKWTREALPQCKIILCEPFVLQFGVVEPDWVPEIAERGKVTAKLAQEFQVPCVPFQTVINSAAQKASPERILRDGVHPRLAGHQAMADAWIRMAKLNGILD